MFAAVCLPALRPTDLFPTAGLPSLCPGCITSLLGLLFSFALSENCSTAPPPKRTASEAGTPAEGSVRSNEGWPQSAG